MMRNEMSYSLVDYNNEYWIHFLESWIPNKDLVAVGALHKGWALRNFDDDLDEHCDCADGHWPCDLKFALHIFHSGSLALAHDIGNCQDASFPSETYFWWALVELHLELADCEYKSDYDKAASHDRSYFLDDPKCPAASGSAFFPPWPLLLLLRIFLEGCTFGKPSGSSKPHFSPSLHRIFSPASRFASPANPGIIRTYWTKKSRLC